MELRIFRQPTKDIQPNGEFYIDTLQAGRICTSGVPPSIKEVLEWEDIEVVEADSY